MINKLVKKIGGCKILFICRVFAEKLKEAFFLLPRLSSGNSDWRKIEPFLRVEVHAIEKGMSIGAVRPGFGKIKAFDLMTHLKSYLNIGGRVSFVEECCSILGKYIEFNKKHGADMSDTELSFNLFCKENDLKIWDFGGIREMREVDVINTLHQDFGTFSQSRFAVRDFGSALISREQIEMALKLAEKTPSACNRQSWKIHIYSKEDTRLKMFKQQGGSRGFYEAMQYAILICGDMNYYRFYELNQVFVDGGLYAMNLMYALHYAGVATIPLTMSMRMSKLQKVLRMMKLPKSEMPILLIGVGSYKSSFKVAKSERVPFIEYTTFEQ